MFCHLIEVMGVCINLVLVSINNAPVSHSVSGNGGETKMEETREEENKDIQDDLEDAEEE